ncbi:MAG TPA: hypothetical protein PL182_07340, partial [Pseudobdellovibrionaceae bacterium]|nr:hypothetical protein [Pseudobdellovibrionaceae bacterium]
MARDLRLDVSFDSSTGRGDGSLHHFGGGAEGMPGLRFLSPVFVNRDLHLPESGSEDGSRSSGYTPVTFGERVILGAGKVYSKGQPYKPASAGGLNERLWASNAS